MAIVRERLCLNSGSEGTFGYRDMRRSLTGATVSHTKSSGRIFVPDLINGCSAFLGEPETRNFHAGLIPSRRASRIDAAPVAPTAAVLTNSCYLIGMRL